MDTLEQVQVEPFRQCGTIDDAYAYARNLANQLIGNKQNVCVSRIYQDRFRKPPSRQIKLIGISAQAAKECERLAPGGKWWVHCDEIKPNYYQFMGWYNRFLPYAYAMMMAEEGFNALGIDYESINSYYKTCIGFVYLGQGNWSVKINVDNPLAVLASGGDINDYIEPTGDASLLVKSDVALFNDCYSASCDVESPSLPFDEAYRPCFCFVAFQRPELFVKYIQQRGRTALQAQEDYRTQHVLAVAEKLDRPKPEFKWK